MSRSTRSMLTKLSRRRRMTDYVNTSETVYRYSMLLEVLEPSEQSREHLKNHLRKEKGKKEGKIFE